VDSDHAEALLEEYGEAALRSGLDALGKRISTAFPEPLRDHFRYLKSLMPGEAKRASAQKELAIAKIDPQSAVSREAQAKLQSRWAEEWLREQREGLVQEIASLSTQTQASLAADLLADMEQRNVHPSIRKRLQTSGWRHQLVISEMVRYYARGAHGDAWDKPTAEELLAVAARSTQLRG
ncbi:MAG: hypothetical protein ABI216_05855, partial [Devosia sp.]